MQTRGYDYYKKTVYVNAVKPLIDQKYSSINCCIKTNAVFNNNYRRNFKKLRRITRVIRKKKISIYVNIKKILIFRMFG